MSFTFEELELPGVILVRSSRHGDDRGYFQETYRRSTFTAGGLEEEFVQDNFARSIRGVLRGLHFQRRPMAQGKLVRVTLGAVLDVAVDLRPESPAFRRWIGVELREAGAMLYIPPGFAHGYYVLSPEAHLAYKVTAEYAPELDSGVRWNDPDLGIVWPSDSPVLSEKDRNLPFLAELPGSVLAPGPKKESGI